MTAEENGRSVSAAGPLGLPKPEDISHERPLWLNKRLGDAVGTGIRVAVVDSGLSTGPHPALEGRSWVDPEHDLKLKVSIDTEDQIGHGTAIAEIVHRLAPKASIVPLKVFGSRLETSPNLISAALDWAAEQGIEVVNLSLGSPMEHAREPLEQACRRANEAGCLLISAVPRGAERVYPACFSEVIGVTAGRYSNIYDLDALDDQTAEFAAQGYCRYRRHGTWNEAFGSSMAAPHLTALTVLLKERFPKADTDGIRSLLRELAAASRSARRL